MNRSSIATPRREPARFTLPRFNVRHFPAPKLLVKAYSPEEAKQAYEAGADFVFYNVLAPDVPANPGFPLGAYLPRILSETELARAMDILRDRRPSAVLAGNAGFLPYRNEFEATVYLDYSLNVFNDMDIAYFQQFKVTPILSPELSLEEMGELHNKQAAVFCHGDIVLVNTKIPIRDARLTDEKGFTFPVRREAGYWQVLNSRPLGLFNEVRRLIEAGFKQFYIDKPGQGGKWAAAYREIMQHEIADRRFRKGHTAGHLYRPVG